MSKITFIDLFGVPGGLSLGFKMAGLSPIATLDSFESGLRTFARNFPEVPESNLIMVDAHKSDTIRYFCKETSLKPGDIDVIVGGPPCQGFSTAGRVKIASLVKNGQRSGRSTNPRFIDDRRNYLYRVFVKFVDHFKPKMVVMENVPGMISYRSGRVVSEIVEDFSKIGYPDVKYSVLNAADFGVPQIRKRIFFVGSYKGRFRFDWPRKTHFKEQNGEGGNPYVTVHDAISDLPRIGIPNKGSKMEDFPRKYSHPTTGFQAWARERSNGIVNNHITRWHRDIDLEVFSTMKQGEKWKDVPIRLRRKIGYSNSSFLDKWKKLQYDIPSWTVVAHLQKDGYMFIHPSQRRTISVREAARLQGFPDDFIFLGSRSAQFKQIGNAVPPLLAMSIGRQIRKSLRTK